MMAFLLDALYDRATVERIHRSTPQVLHNSGYLCRIDNVIVLQSPIRSDARPPVYHFMIYNTAKKFTSYYDNCREALLGYRQIENREKALNVGEKS